MLKDMKLNHLALVNLWKNVNLAYLGFLLRMNVSYYRNKPYKVRKVVKYLCINLMGMMQSFVELESLELAFEASECLSWFVDSFFNDNENFSIVRIFKY
jgi:hypothetical protein